jgi:hypothetical protein
MRTTLADQEQLLEILNQAGERLAIGLEFAGRAGIHIPALAAVARNLSAVIGEQVERVAQIRGREPPN